MKINSACAGCFAGLACGARIEILNLLQDKGELSVLEIAKHFELTQPTVTHHLKYLKEIGLLKSRKDGTKVFYSIDTTCPNKSEEECKILQ